MKYIFKFTGIIFISLLAACGGGGSNDNNDTQLEESGSIRSPALFSRGNDITVKTSVINDSGGEIVVSDTETYLDGVKIVFPPGALHDSSDITVGYDDGVLTLPEGISTSTSAKTLTIHTTGSSSFSQLVEITIPYDDSENIPVPFYIDSQNRLNPVHVINVDQLDKTLTFVTSHASLWAWLEDIKTDSPDTDTGFRPLNDGFRIANYGSTINIKGECYGMCSFAHWYFIHQSTFSGELFDRYMNEVGADSEGNALKGQDVIATRAHSAINQAFSFSRVIAPQVNTTDEYRYNSIVQNSNRLGLPMLLILLRPEDEIQKGTNHAVLAYGVDESDGQVFIYDPNYPGSRKIINYDHTSKRFEPYGPYTKVVVDGYGTYDLNESLENIFLDAEHDFTSDNKPQITISSHVNGEVVNNRIQTLTGSIESSEILINELEVIIGNVSLITKVGEDGAFTIPLTLDVGENKLRFITRGEVDHKLIPISPNNMDANPFNINVDIEKSVMMVTLTWDKVDTDLDLYVIDPVGDYSAYYNKTTLDGGELDHDITTGYGPEHWTLSSTDNVRWGQASYTVRVHYYDNNGNGGTNYKLSVLLYEGTDREVEYIKTGYLSVSDIDNDKPGDSGADWVDFTFPIMLEEPTLTLSRSLTSKVQPHPNDRVTKEVPSFENRRALKEE